MWPSLQVSLLIDVAQWTSVNFDYLRQHLHEKLGCPYVTTSSISG